jgi:hypothetical protein
MILVLPCVREKLYYHIFVIRGLELDVKNKLYEVYIEFEK